MLFHNAPPPYQVNPWVVAGITVAIGGFWAFAIGKAVAVKRSPVLIGPSDVVGETGEMRRDGLVFVRGELWRAHSEEPLAPGDQVEVERVEDGLVLGVRRLA